MQVAAKFLIGNSGNREKFLCTHVGEYASLADGGQSRVLGSENLLWTCSNASFEGGKRFGTTPIARQIGNVLPDD